MRTTTEQGNRVGVQLRRSAVVASVVLLAIAACSGSDGDGDPASAGEAGAGGEGAGSGAGRSSGGSHAGTTPVAGSGLGGVQHSGGQAGASADAGSSGATLDGGAGGQVGSTGGQSAAGESGTDDAGSGNTPVGAGGQAGDGSGGAPPLEPGTGNGTLGASCTDSTDCKAGLGCLSGQDKRLNGAAPPGGLCTVACESDTDCKPEGLCYAFNDDGSGYCVEGCTFGPPEIGDSKCHDRANFTCAPALLAVTNEPCQTAASCQDGELCMDGFCNVVFPGCMPSCRGDLDCAEGLYCDQSFLIGTCTPVKPVGKRLGEPCTVPGPGDADEPDECLGFCQADSAGSANGHCSATCGLLGECAWDAASQKFDGACFYASALTADIGDAGDFGFCTPACNCSEECNDENLVCLELSQVSLPDTFRGPGLCFSPSEGDVPIDECAE